MWYSFSSKINSCSNFFWVFHFLDTKKVCRIVKLFLWETSCRKGNDSFPLNDVCSARDLHYPWNPICLMIQFLWMIFMNSCYLGFLTEFDKIYTRLDVTLIERGESFYQNMMGGVVAELERKGLSKILSSCIRKLLRLWSRTNFKVKSFICGHIGWRDQRFPVFDQENW